MPVTPTIHTFDPQISGKVGVYIDAPPSYDQTIWYASKSATSGFAEIAVLWPNATIGLDGLTLIMDAGAPGSTVFVECKLHDSTGYGALCAPVACTVSSGPPAPPPPPTAQQELEDALGTTLNIGDQVALYPQPSVVKTVQADGSLT